MPPRGRAPGLKRGRHNLPYWMARNVARDPKGFPDTCIPLPPDATDDQLVELCQGHTARLRSWIAEHTTEEPQLTRTRYDGTMTSACRIYQEHPLSPFHGVKHTTAKFYTTCLRRIEDTVGARLIRNVTLIDVKHWYSQWRKGAVTKDADGNEVIGPERIDRAHDTVAMVRTVIYFMAALRHKDCITLKGDLEDVRFEKGGAREEELTLVQARDFIRTAIELGDKGLMPRDRARNMAIGVAAQFELLLRQKDIIGEWAPAKANRKIPKGASVLELGAENAPTEIWAGFFTWEQVPAWRWRMKTSKSKYRSASDFDLTRYGLLYPLLEMVPLDQRVGAIVKGEQNLPVRERSYGNWFRKIARAARIPDNVWNMDSRAGGATEAFDAGAGLPAISQALTHTEQNTTLRYIRRQTKANSIVAEARGAQRAADENDSGTG